MKEEAQEQGAALYNVAHLPDRMGGGEEHREKFPWGAVLELRAKSLVEFNSEKGKGTGGGKQCKHYSSVCKGLVVASSSVVLQANAEE